jgi:hypothetical protein
LGTVLAIRWSRRYRLREKRRFGLIMALGQQQEA